jgi:hypothetical protein
LATPLVPSTLWSKVLFTSIYKGIPKIAEHHLGKGFASNSLTYIASYLFQIQRIEKIKKPNVFTHNLPAEENLQGQM